MRFEDIKRGQILEIDAVGFDMKVEVIGVEDYEAVNSPGVRVKYADGTEGLIWSRELRLPQKNKTEG
tara:strand:- start:228 stop:428 length:201 start_codon:yes stop_codon:yes gene_type:complete